MQRNEYFEKCIEDRKALVEEFTRGAYRACEAYMDSKNRGSDILEVYSTIWDNEVVDFVKTLRTAGVDEFAITQRSTNLIDLAVALESQGCVLKCTVAVVRRNDYNEIANGLKFRVIG